MADPMALVVADAAARAVEFVGLPEAQLNLAQAVVHLATAPKSNRAAVGHLAGPRGRHRRRGGRGAALTSAAPATAAPPSSATESVTTILTTTPRGWVEQEYRPPAAAGRTYYTPSTHGFEQEIAERMARLRNQVRNEDRTGRDDDGRQ